MEKDSGIQFYKPVGCLSISAPTVAAIGEIDHHDGDVLKACLPPEGEGEDIKGCELPPAVYLKPAELRQAFPFMKFLDKDCAVWENGTGGYIAPRRQILAHMKLATQVPSVAGFAAAGAGDREGKAEQDQTKTVKILWDTVLGVKEEEEEEGGICCIETQNHGKH